MTAAPIRFRTLDFVDEVEDAHPSPAAKPTAKPPGAKRSRGGGRWGGRVGKGERSLSQPTQAAEPMDEEGEDDFIKERPRRISASQVWRIWALFQLFLDNPDRVWLFFGDFQTSLGIFSHFLWRF